MCKTIMLEHLNKYQNIHNKTLESKSEIKKKITLNIYRIFNFSASKIQKCILLIRYILNFKF